MNYIINGYDYKDSEALNRRNAAREEHIENIKKLKAEGKILYAAAMLNEEEQMCGSTIIAEMSKQELEAYLEVEAYISGKVWEKVEIIPCKIPPFFR